MCRSATTPQKLFSLRRRRVDFSMQQKVDAIDNTIPENSTWYTPNEIESFKNDARTFSRAIRQQNLRIQNASNTSSEVIATTVCKRGLECRIDQKRQIKRRLLIRKVLKAQNIMKLSSYREREQYLAMLSCKESFLAKCEALAEASLDARVAN